MQADTMTIDHIIDRAAARTLVDDTLAQLLAIAVKKGNSLVADELRWTIKARSKQAEATPEPKLN